MNREKWCEHCEVKPCTAKNSWRMWDNDAYANGWKFCPICGTPRPEAPREKENKCPNPSVYGIFTCSEGHLHQIEGAKMNCDGSRPEEKRELWAILHEMKAGTRYASGWQHLTEVTAKEMAQAAMTWLKELVDSLPNCDCSNVRCQEGCVNKYNLKALLSQEGAG